MRIAFDVSPLSHQRTGVNNYIRGSLAGLAEVARPLGHEIVAFAPTSPAGKRIIPQALDGIDVETRLVALPGADRPYDYDLIVHGQLLHGFAQHRCRGA